MNVDSISRAKLKKAVGVDQITEILGKAVFQKRAHCLRHPFNVAGCFLPRNIDLETRLNYSNTRLPC